jgi:polyisoprenoid-binding protein YceI
LASVSTGSAEADDLLRERDFFAAKQFPQATFRSTATSSTNGDQFQVLGDFTLKGRSNELVIPFTARQEPNGMHIEGRFAISRHAYKVGEGQWADTGTIADEVMIRFNLYLPR